MNLELAIVQSCSESGCQVQFLDAVEPVEVTYSSQVQDRIRIRRGQLVAVNIEAAPPEIVWRWFRVSVLHVEGETVFIEARGHHETVTCRAELGLNLQSGDEAWMAGTSAGHELFDQVLEGKPAHPGRLKAYSDPIIAAEYAGLPPAR